jgi:hypothetical protein
MLTKTCCDCEQTFAVEEAKAWATRCLPCWIAQQDRQGKKKVEALQHEVDYWRSRAHGHDSHAAAQALQKKVERLEQDNLKLRLEVMSTRARTARSALPADWKAQLSRLIQLCHPDKHSGSDAANAATVWLLGLKRGGTPQKRPSPTS